MMNFVALRLNKLNLIMRKFRRDTRGTIIVMLAFAMPLLVGFLGLSIDVTNWYLSKREAQTAADAAALAGAYQLYHTNSTSVAYTAAHNGASKNGFKNSGAQTVTPQSPPASGAYTSDATAVEVIIGESQTLYLASIIFGNAVNVSTRAVAASEKQPGYHCLVALDTDMDDAIDIGGDADIQLNCGIASNSGSLTASHLYGSSRVIASPLSAVGQVVNAGEYFEGEVKNFQLPAIDPYGSAGRNLDVPTYSGCNYTDSKVQGTEVWTPAAADDYIFVICNDLTIHGDLTLNQGIYIFDETSLRVNSSATITGDNVTLIFAGEGNNYGTIDINGSASIDLTATNYDTTSLYGYNYDGILIMQDPDADQASGENKINGGSDIVMQGSIYFPNQEIEISGNHNSTDTCLQLIANNVTFTGNSALINNCPSDPNFDEVEIREVVLVE